MNTTVQQHSAFNHEEIARLAWQIWQKDGGQSGRDQEYWLQAERQLRAISQQKNVPTNNALMTLRSSEQKVNNTNSQPAKLARASNNSPKKRVSAKL